MKCCLGFELKKGSDFFMVGERLCIVGGHYDGQYGSFLGDCGLRRALVDHLDQLVDKHQPTQDCQSVRETLQNI